MSLTVKCKACDRPITFDQETQALEKNVYEGRGGRVTEYYVQCPMCPSRQWATFATGKARTAGAAGG